MAVQAPDGRWLDIDGPRDGQEVTGWISKWGLPARLRLLGDPAEWHVMLGRPASTPATWWRTQISSDTSIALVESFARSVLANSAPPSLAGSPAERAAGRAS